MSDSDRNPVTLEDVLKLKRAEQPDQAFWDGFDARFRARTLATLHRDDSRAHVFWSYCAARLRVIFGAGAVGAIGAAAMALFLMGAAPTVPAERVVVHAAVEQSAPVAEIPQAAPQVDFAVSVLDAGGTGAFQRQMAVDSLDSGLSDRSFGLDTMERSSPLPVAVLTRHGF
jgi:hypothetical protein